ncbi:hypothetical protein RQ191_003023 [Salmonella enterica subsp. enterica serovar Infantis]|nr:hypothetical protein [Salmonella enterica]ELI0252609.1 hypothetical protein [Salmonella enterica subsp. enterica serovar Infantis]
MQRLSLLARGTLDESSSNNDCAGFIPAGAGNTHGHSGKALVYDGLSPLARGTH